MCSRKLLAKLLRLGLKLLVRLCALVKLLPQVHLCQDQFVALLQEADVAGLVIGPLLAHKLKLLADRLVHRIPLLIGKGVAHRVALAVSVLALLLALRAHLVPHAQEGIQRFRIFSPLRGHLALVARLHGPKVLLARPLDVRQHLYVLGFHLLQLVLHDNLHLAIEALLYDLKLLCVRLLQLVHLVLLGYGGGSETLHDGQIGRCKRPAGFLPLIIHLAPLLVGPGVPPPGSKGGGEARQALCSELIQHLLL